MVKYDIMGVSNFKLLGFATGNYSCKCLECGTDFVGDKRAHQCLDCAIKQSKLIFQTQNKSLNTKNILDLKAKILEILNSNESITFPNGVGSISRCIKSSNYDCIVDEILKLFI